MLLISLIYGFFVFLLNNPQYQTQGLFNQYEKLIARRNVGKADEILNRQQGDIDLINEEYQTRFGGLSRYG